MTSLVSHALAIAIQTLVGLVFLSAAIGKVRHWAPFHGVVANYRLLADFLIVPVTYGLPPAEALIAVMLLLRVAFPWPQVAAVGLLLLFAAAMGINVWRGRRDIDCGCFQSALKQRLRWTLVIRNVVIALALSLTLLLQQSSTDVWIMMEAMLAAGVLFILLQSLNLFWSIMPAWRRLPALEAGVGP